MLRPFKMTLCLLIALFLAFGASRSTLAEDPPAVQPKPAPTVQEMINEVAPLFKQSPTLIAKIAYCESSFQDVSHDNGAGKGVTGIHLDTFNYWLPSYEAENHETLNYNSSYDQLKMMSWAFSQGSAYRNQWTTYVAYLNGGTYSFYSPSLHAHYVVHCE